MRALTTRPPRRSLNRWVFDVAFTVDLSHLLALVEQMEQFDQRVVATCEEVEQSVTALSGTWEGTSAEQQREAHSQWSTGAAEMSEALRQLKADIATAHRNYDRAFAAGSAMWDVG
jgi:WXG100 family type VII secretion target